jgi:triacylglycerol esterase/lipase EstA (alpha/beta hydrolase family)
MRRLLIIGMLFLAQPFFVLGSGGETETTRANHVDPILFVHGYTSNASTWDLMKSRFVADGWESNRLYAYTFSSSVSNATIAQAVAQRVNEIKAATGAAKVDIITHSMGGLSSRYYIKNLGGAANVDDWVSIAGPNHGTTWAYGCFFFSPCNQMIPGSSFLNQLNSGDETPGAVNYGTWWSSCDELINPDTSTILSGATNTAAGCLSHSGIKDSATVYAQIRNFVQ